MAMRINAPQHHIEPAGEAFDFSIEDVAIRVVEADELSALRRVFPALPAEPAGTTLVAWEGNTPVGHIQVRWRGSVHSFVRARYPKTPEVRRLRVLPHAQGRGIAKALLNEVEEHAVLRGFRSLGLAVGVLNEIAIHLYLTLGYKSAGVADFESSMGMDQFGKRFTHQVRYMVKPIGRSSFAEADVSA
jgi:ribosomal protein S18 acetylase RimI-like enzyme